MPNCSLNKKSVVGPLCWSTVFGLGRETSNIISKGHDSMHIQNHIWMESFKVHCALYPCGRSKAENERNKKEVHRSIK